MNEQLTQYIDTIAAKLGVAAEHVYGVLIRQQYVSGAGMAVVSLIMASIVALIVVMHIKTIKKADYTKDSWTTRAHNGWAKYLLLGDGAVFTMVSIVGVFLAAITIGVGYSAVTHLINPEYYAIKELLNVVKGGN